jgi:diketogulonate reductase-like aldo/keto reductase
MPKVGFGTWSLGGRESPDAREDAKSLAALRSALTLGYVHFDTAEMYAGGHCEELLGEALRELGIDRGSVFITTKVSAENLGAADVIRACVASLKRLQMEFVDLYLIHWPNRSIPLRETFKGLNALLQSGKVHHVGVSNFDLPLIKQAEALAEAPLFTNQVPLGIFERGYQANGVLEYCQSRGILVTAYSPLKHRRVRTDSRIATIATERGLTPFQIALAWVCNQPGVITIPMSTNPRHQRDNLAAADLELTAGELAALN